MLGYPPTPPWGARRLTIRPTYTPPPAPSRPPKVFAPGWGLEFEQAAPLGPGAGGVGGGLRSPPGTHTTQTDRQNMQGRQRGVGHPIHARDHPSAPPPPSATVTGCHGPLMARTARTPPPPHTVRKEPKKKTTQSGQTTNHTKARSRVQIPVAHFCRSWTPPMPSRQLMHS